MEYFGKILCISKEDLTRDDRPMVGGYQIDDIKAPIMSVSSVSYTHLTLPTT